MPDGRLPPILPVVHYNGDPRWQAPVDLSDLIGLPEGSALWQWQPAMRFQLIHEGAFSPGDLKQREGLPALLFRLENAANAAPLAELADALLAWFADSSGFQAARAVFVELLSTAMAPVVSDVRVPEELQEVRSMLVTRMEAWAKQQLLEAEQRGEQRGREQGEQRGPQGRRAEGSAERKAAG